MFNSFSLHTLIQAKIEKRARRDLYEGSKLLDQRRKMVGVFVSYVDWV